MMIWFPNEEEIARAFERLLASLESSSEDDEDRDGVGEVTGKK